MNIIIEIYFTISTKKRGKNMPNINDYIKWRGDLELKISEFNEIDSLILSRFSYLPFEGLMNKEEKITIEELAKRFEKADQKNLEILWPDDSELLPLLGKSKRFRQMIATNFINKFDPEQENKNRWALKRWKFSCICCYFCG